MKKPSHANIVENHLAQKAAWLSMNVFTQEKNHSHANIVTNHIQEKIVLSSMKKVTLLFRSYSHAACVTNLSCRIQILRDT